MTALKRALPDAMERLQALLARADVRFRRAFAQVIGGIHNVWTLEYLSALIEQGQIERALEVAQRNAQLLGAASNQTYMSAGEAASAAAGEVLGLVIDFDQVNQHAVSIMQRNRLRLVRQFTEDQRGAVRVALTQAITEGINPIDQARRIREVIGLTERQSQAVQNYRRLLNMGSSEALTRALRDRRFDPSVVSAIEGGRILDPDTVDRMVDRYRQRYLRYRSEVIARTESLRSVHEGQAESFRQMVSGGQLKGQRVVRRWVTALDDRVRDSHADMHGQEVGWDEPFTTGNGVQLMYPGDPAGPPEEVIQCRCVVTTRIVTEGDAP